MHSDREPSKIESRGGQKVRNPSSKTHPNYKWTVVRVFRASANYYKLKRGDIFAISIVGSKGIEYGVSSENGLNDFIICEDCFQTGKTSLRGKIIRLESLVYIRANEGTFALRYKLRVK